MKNNQPRRVTRLARCAVSILGLVTLTAMAQTTPDEIEEVLVTGSRIPQANLVGANPVTQIGKDELLYSGATRLEDLLKNLPQVYAAQSSGDSNSATGTATLDLRHLGAQRTLVLVDGRRLGQGSPFTAGTADINQIPGAMIERVEILTGGASAIYGSDAIAGVVNFILQKDFEGVQLDYELGQYAHENRNDQMQDLLTQRGYEIPDSHVHDGDTKDASILAGRNFADGRGNLIAYATWRNIDPVLQADRDYSACALQGPVGEYFCGGSSSHEKGRFQLRGPPFRDPNDPLYTTELNAPYDLRVEGDTLVPNNRYVYNFNPLNYYQRPDERWTAGANGHFEFNEHVEVYTQLMYMDDSSIAQIAPTAAFGIDTRIACDNPFLSAQEVQVLCTDRGVTDFASAYVSRRNIEGGPRTDDLQHTSYRGVLGLRGDMVQGWHYDIYAQRAEVTLKERFDNDFLNSRIRRALDISVDPATGQPACKSAIDGTDPACVPWNIFKTGGVTQQALDYLQVPLIARGSTEQTLVSGYVTGDLGVYGAKSPFAEQGLELVLGLEYRDEDLEYDPDENYRSGDASSGVSTKSDGGGFDVTEFFTELKVPLLSDRPLVEALDMDLGYRYSDYSTGASTDTYGIAASWNLNPEWMLRASLHRAVRVPNIDELYSPQNLGFTDLIQSDPCAGADPESSLAECERTGVTTAQYGSIIDTPFEGMQIREGGNADLEPEKADTLSAGVVFTPDFVDDLTLSLDWFEIKIEQAIEVVSADVYLRNCLAGGDPVFCARIHRSTTGESTGTGVLWTDDGYIDTIKQNIGYFRTSGIDAVLDYSFDIGGGTLSLHDVAGYVDKLELQTVPGEPALACEGNWGDACDKPNPEWRNQLRLTWATPWNLTFSAAWRYIGGTQAIGVDPNTGGSLEDLDAIDYFDLAGVWEITPKVTARLGVNNLLDEEPPVFNAGGTFSNGNTFPGIYDALGQYWFAGLGVKF